MNGRRCSLALCLLSYLLSSAGRAETYSTLPPPPSPNAPGASQQYMLGLVINEQDNGQVVPVEFRDNHYYLRAGDLQRAGIPSALITSSMMDVSAMPQVKADYDQARQRLLLTVPPGWLPRQKLNNEERNGPRFPGRTSTGALFNYDLYTSRTTASGSRLSAFPPLTSFACLARWGSFPAMVSGSSSFPARRQARRTRAICAMTLTGVIRMKPVR